MQHCDAMKNHLLQLAAVLQIPIAQFELDNHTDVFLDAKLLLNQSPNCCIVVAIKNGPNKLQNFKNLYRCISLLKRLQRQLCNDYPTLETSLIGVYPSLDYPACVYEINTAADFYVSENVLPCTGSAFISTVKQLISKLLGTNPAVGGMGLILYKE